MFWIKYETKIAMLFYSKQIITKFLTRILNSYLLFLLFNLLYSFSINDSSSL